MEKGNNLIVSGRLKSINHVSLLQNIEYCAYLQGHNHCKWSVKINIFLYWRVLYAVHVCQAQTQFPIFQLPELHPSYY